MKLRIAAVLLAVAGLTAGAGVTAAYASPASSPNYYVGQYCYEYLGEACQNAWNGGPFVNVYTKGVKNNDFALIASGSSVNIQFGGGGSWNGKCVGDAYNDPNNGYTSLDPCGSGWGTNFTLIVNPAGQGTFAFKNGHWSSIQGRNDYLCPVNNYHDGSPFVLNSAAECIFYWNPLA